MVTLLSTLSTGYFSFVVLNTLLAIIIITLERRNPTTALAWLFFMVLFPGFGFFFFVLLSQNLTRKKIFKYTQDESEIYASVLIRQKELLLQNRLKFNDESTYYWSDLILYHNNLSESFYSQNNHIELIYDGDSKFNLLMDDIKKAKDHIHIEYYIVKNDSLSNKLFNLLIEKAAEGVHVRILLDDFGCRSIPLAKINDMRKKGLEIHRFFPSQIRPINFKANYRNHRKIAIIDGQIGYTGGYNVGNEYINLSKRFGHWRDTHLRIQGDAVAGLQLRFLMDYRSASNEKVTLLDHYLGRPKYRGNSGIQIVSSGPDSQSEQIKQGFIKMISKARHYILIQSPYFVPDESILEALKIAVGSGVEISIIIPNKPDHPFVYWATYSYIGELLAYNINVYTYEAGFIHSKVIVVDDEVSSVGTCNFDIRSFRLNFEVNAFIYDDVVAKNLRKQFFQDINQCNPLTYEKYKKRSLLIKSKEAFSRLFSPVL